MFEAAELNHKLGKKEFKKEIEKIRGILSKFS
ncbi:MAG: hypothetical protein PWQ25_199 [Deferribacteres bacterium]|jgi:hypothetical protein|nr:hypothetical protein [Deferribacteres bacterium]